jgi:hypothetical protein
VGVEARAELVDNAEANLAAYGIDADRFRFIAGDVFDVLAKEQFDVDVVMCLGFLYHTLRYNELLQRIRRINPRHVVIDTEVMPGGRGKALLLIRTESTTREGNAVPDEFSHGDSVLIGKPNLKGLRTVLRAYDFSLERLSDWGGLIRDNPDAGGVEDYAQRARVTACFRSVAP